MRYVPHALLVLIMLLISARSGVCVEIHVAAKGSDTWGDGGPKTPFATLARALEKSEPGDTIVLGQGTYRGGHSIRQPNLTIMSKPGEWAVIKAPIRNEDDDICLYVKTEARGLTLRRLELVGGYHYALMLESTWDWGQPEKEAASDITVEDCRIHDTGRDCVKITPGADNVTIRRCEIFNSGKRDDSNAEGIDNVNGDNLLVQDTYIHDIATTGVYCKGGATNCVIERCLVERCGGQGIALGFDTSPEWFDTDFNPELYECRDSRVRNCLVRDTSYAGIALYASFRCLVMHNTVVNAASGGQSPLFFGLAYHDWEEGVPRPPNTYPIIRNNIFTLSPKSDRPMVEIRHSDDLGGMSALEGPIKLSHNCYFAPGKTPYFKDLRPNLEFEGNLAAWQKHMRGETGSFVADPELDEKSHLKASSPCIQVGARLRGVSDDYDGQARGEKTSLGADEFTPTGGLTVPPAKGIVGTGKK